MSTKLATNPHKLPRPPQTPAASFLSPYRKRLGSGSRLRPGFRAPRRFRSRLSTTWTFYTFSGWQGIGEDLQSLIQNPGFANSAYPADDFSLPKGSPGAGFVVFDANQAGRSNPMIKPPAVAATFPTKKFDPATDY